MRSERIVNGATGIQSSVPLVPGAVSQVFTKNRDRSLEGAVAKEFFSLLVSQARGLKLLSDQPSPWTERIPSPHTISSTDVSAEVGASPISAENVGRAGFEPTTPRIPGTPVTYRARSMKTQDLA
jgi:hypothetical protein